MQIFLLKTKVILILLSSCRGNGYRYLMKYFFSWYLQYFIRTVVLLMATFIFTRNTWWLYADVPSSCAVVLQQQWIYFRRSIGKVVVTCSGAQRVEVFKWKVWGMIPPSWVQVLTPSWDGTQKYSLSYSCLPPSVLLRWAVSPGWRRKGWAGRLHCEGATLLV